MKIGATSARLIQDRLNNLQPGYPGRLRCFGEYECNNSWDVERKAHNQLKDRRIFGEWFRVSADEARAAIQEAIASTEPPAPRGGFQVSADNLTADTARKLEAATPFWLDVRSDRLPINAIARHVGLSPKR
jgi:hypothetical protein